MTEHSDQTTSEPEAKPKRLLSLDAVRGFVIASMLLVNLTWAEETWGTGLGESIAFQLAHVPAFAPAQGATFTDLVFPWFLFIMGASIPLSIASQRKRGSSNTLIILRAAKRALFLYLIGIVITCAGIWLNNPIAWTDLLRWNILQLIAAASFIATGIALLPKRWWPIIITTILLAKLALIVSFSPAWLRPHLAEAFTEIGRADRWADAEPTARNVITHMDDVRRFTTREHLEGTPLNRAIGWLAMAQQYLPGAAIALMGALSTTLLTKHEAKAKRSLTLLAWGIAITTLAYILALPADLPSTNTFLQQLFLPFSKWIFTPSYCLLAAGTGMIILALADLIIDVWNQRWFANPWRTWGVNALALYAGAELSYKLVFSQWQFPLPNGQAAAIPGALNTWVAHWLKNDDANPKDLLTWPAIFNLEWTAGSLNTNAISGLTAAICWLTFWYLVCRLLDKNKIYIKV